MSRSARSPNRFQRIGRYFLMDRIAFGGMAEVFRGFSFDDEGHRTQVAIKQLLPHYVEDEQFVTMLVDEYRLVSRMRHPHVARVYDLVRIREEILIAMEYVDGKDLGATVEKAVRDRIPIDYAQMAYVMACALDGLHHAHEMVDERGANLDVVHRDFSPSNVLVSYDGTVKMIDFGIAKSRRNRIQTKAGIIKGKVKYMSPEQAFGHKLDHRSDVFSAGSVLYELATGVPPFRAKSEVDLIFEVRRADPPSPKQVCPDLPEELARIIERSMARARSARYQTSKEFRDALVRFLKAYAPNYRRTNLARLMKQVWASEIEADLRKLEDFVIELPSDFGDIGENLLAESEDDMPAEDTQRARPPASRPALSFEDDTVPQSKQRRITRELQPHAPLGMIEAKTEVTPDSIPPSPDESGS